MRLARRDCLKAGALAGAGALLTGCDGVIHHFVGPEPPQSVSLPPGNVDPLARLVSRVSFGTAPGELERVARIGPEAYVDEQLAAGREEPAFVRMALHGNPALHTDPVELHDEHISDVLRQLQQATLLLAVYSPNQLRERMVDFWSNHFNIFARKGHGAYYIPTDAREVVREHALDTFPDLLYASAHSPAMLAYLDNQVNRRGVANENYAREVMELHTLGLHGGYTQKDVQEVARCLTGWTWENRFLHSKGTFRFDESLHDFGKKTVLGHRIPATRPGATVYNHRLGRRIPAGQQDGETVLEILAHHPATARFISRKLCRHFLGSGEATESGHSGSVVRPPSSVTASEERMAATYLQTGGDIKSMLRPMLLSEELRSGPPLLKRPLEFMVSALRALAADSDCGRHLQFHLARMGQPLYQWPMPDGYPDKTSAWTGSLLARWNYAFALTSGRIKGTTVDPTALVRMAGPSTDTACADALMGLLLGRRADSEELRSLRDRLAKHIARAPRRQELPALSEAAALLLSSPQFQWA